MLESVLQRLITTAIAVLVLNGLWAGVLHSQSGRITGACGSLIALAVIVSVWLSQRIRSSVLANPPAFLAHPRRALAVVVPFILPAFFLYAKPVFAFWQFDGRSALLVAWLISIVLAIGFEVDGQETPRTAPQEFLIIIFLVFSAGLWLAIVMDSGVARFMMEIDRRGPRACQADPIATMATVWESAPVSEHLFLGWRSPGDFERRTVYANHVHPFLLSMYGWMRTARRLGGLTVWQASNTTILLPVFVIIAGFATLVVRSGHHSLRFLHLFALFIAVGILLTTWRLWIDLVRFNSDSPYPLAAGILLLLYALLLEPMHTKSAAVAAALFAAVTPLNTPMLVLPLVCMFGRSGQNLRDLFRQNRAVVVICAAAAVAGAVSYLEPQILIRWKGYPSQGSSFLFRSGLDGDTRYFSGPFQAVVASCPVGCCYARSLSELLVPSVVPLAVLGPLVWWWSASQGASIVRMFVFLVTPYLMSVILFPQSVSIHPYIYDHWFIIPAVVSGVMAMVSAAVEDRLSGAALLAFLLFAGAVLMSNLLGIAQGVAGAIAFFTS